MATGFSGRLLACRYRLGDYLGGGGMADVYRAVDTRLQRQVAVKLFRSGTDAAGRHRFEEEALLLARLNHPGLVTVYDAGTSDSELFLAMFLVEGPTLGDVMAAGPMPPERVAFIGQQLADVLAYVHDCGVIHRDVKPSNILLSTDNHVFLADFGVSRLVDAVGRVTATGTTVGTAAYMAPEQVSGKESGPAIDIYALGLVLLECLTGHPEYAGNGAEAAVARLARPPHIPAGLPSPLAEALRAMTDAQPARRSTAAQCAALLGSVTSHNGLTTEDAPTVRISLAGRGKNTLPRTSFLSSVGFPSQHTAPDSVRQQPSGWRAAAALAVSELAEAIRHRRLSGITRHGWSLFTTIVAGLAVFTSVLLASAAQAPATSPAPATQPMPVPAANQPAGPDRLPADLANLEKAVRG